jgi:hypothetical protein
MLPALSEHVSTLLTAAHNASSCTAVPMVLQSTTQVSSTHFMSTELSPPRLTSHSSEPERHGLPGNEPVGKHAPSVPGFKHEKPASAQVLPLHLRTQMSPADSEQVRLGSTAAQIASSSCAVAPPPQLTTQVSFTQLCVRPPGRSPQVLPAQGLPGNEPVGKHEFSCAPTAPASRQEKPVSHAPALPHERTQMLPAAFAQVSVGLTIEHSASP